MMRDKSEDKIPVKGVVPINEMVGDDDEDMRLLRVMASGAEKYIRSFPWCKSIRKIYFGDGYGGIVAVFLFHIEPARDGCGRVAMSHLLRRVSRVPSDGLVQNPLAGTGGLHRGSV
jgi:hypothetical protein